MHRRQFLSSVSAAALLSALPLNVVMGRAAKAAAVAFKPGDIVYMYHRDAWAEFVITSTVEAGSFNGRTSGLGPDDAGSIPAPAARPNPPAAAPRPPAR